jgi:hypothetical protein
MDPTTGGCGSVDLATSSGNAQDQARWAFLFPKIIYEGGLLNSTASVKRLTEAVDLCRLPRLND